MYTHTLFLPWYLINGTENHLDSSNPSYQKKKKKTNHKDNVTPQGLSRSYNICPRPYSIIDKVKTRTIQPDSWFKLLSTSYYNSISISKRAYSCPQRVRWITFCLLPLTLFKTARMKEIITRTSKEFTLHSFSDGYWISGKLLRPVNHKKYQIHGSLRITLKSLQRSLKGKRSH